MNFENTKRFYRLFPFIFVAATACLGSGEGLIVVNELSGKQVTAVGGHASVPPASLSSLAPPGATTFDLTIDTAADILVIAAELSVNSGAVFVEPSSFWNHASSPPECILPFCGRPPAEYWNWRISTPGAGAAADDSDLLTGERVVHFDTTDEGAQSGFHFASFTLLPDARGQAEAILDLQIQTAAQPTPVFDDVRVTMSIVPEPNAGVLTAMGFIVFVIARRRLR